MTDESGQRAGTSVPASLPEISPTRHEYLWAPWRMRYVAQGTHEEGCIFCNRLASDDDVQALILHRGERAFVIMNLFPYNTGHVMIVPNAHVDSPERAEPETMQEMAALRAPVLRALRRALACDGFNLGLNVGGIAGAGVAEHLHEHVVPRWQGDANFMPILASTMVMPELIPVTYAKLRAEIERELGGERAVSSVVLRRDGSRVLLDAAGELPSTVAEEGEALWRAALRDAPSRGARDVELLGWAGTSRAEGGAPALLLRATLRDEEVRETGHQLQPVDAVRDGDFGSGAAAALDRIREPNSA